MVGRAKHKNKTKKTTLQTNEKIKIWINNNVIMVFDYIFDSGRVILETKGNNNLK